MVDRTRVVSWQDPSEALERAAGLPGLELLNRIASGLLPAPPVAELIGFAPTFVAPGIVVFSFEPREEHYNPLGSVHGGIVTTLLDTAMGCAVHSELDGATGYTTVELKTSFVRPVTVASGTLRAEGKVVHRGSRLATAEARLEDGAGKLFAHATCTCLLFPAGARSLAAA